VLEVALELGVGTNNHFERWLFSGENIIEEDELEVSIDNLACFFISDGCNTYISLSIAPSSPILHALDRAGLAIPGGCVSHSTSF
jgi:hypothetical protein